ncbi:Cof-type HAD-IIB family hydrolase [Mycoplasma mycoides]|uniref:Cof-type HAD-IIB family hydrolase n=1 Tax=Mycoplasma mycoides TaxID=2102 RepID=UPI0022409D63|nr:Cof-type HAD-IIB family hydrolase [Mycoplasma mycoides]QVJ95644.1 HAD family phosphatase [Mycoplasma mycoides subsp. capri]
MKLKDLNLKRLILIDLDGTTLTNQNDQIHKITKKAILDAQKNGHVVCIVTGRPFRAVEHIYKELKLTTLLANFDGAHIHDPNNKLMKRVVLPINYEIIKQIINESVIKDNVENILIEYYDKSLLWKSDKELEDFFHLNKAKNSKDFQFIKASPYTTWKSPSNNLVLKLKSDKHKDEVIRVLTKYQDAIKIQSDILYGITTSKTKPVITLTNKNADKGFASIFLAQYYNKDIRDVIAFGDQLNDLEMLKTVGCSVAMKNGVNSLKFVAKGITHYTNDEGGLGHYLNLLLAGKEV